MSFLDEMKVNYEPTIDLSSSNIMLSVSIVCLFLYVTNISESSAYTSRLVFYNSWHVIDVY